jgi:hypothetical protein
MQTRLEKYKNYRQQIKDVVENSKKNEKSPSTRMMVNSNTTNTSSALPLNEIVKEEKRISEEEIALRKQERKRILKYTAIGAGLVIAACIIIIIGILLFK